MNQQRVQVGKKEIVISNATKDRVEACKTYIESNTTNRNIRKIR